jgi:dTDP-4-amino-4,6-dideoxygalactose transaminase
VANGTDALELCLRSFDLPKESKVAVPAHTAVATATAVVRAGHAPVFVDIDPVSFTMCPDSLRNACEANPEMAAVIPVHLYGLPCDMTAIAAIAEDYGMTILEDCSQAHGAIYGGRKVGTIGRAAAFSCYPTKNLGAVGDAGIVASTEQTVLDRVRLLRQYGWQQRYVSDEVGMNSRLDELQAAILRVQLRHLDADNARRRTIAEQYTQGLAGLPLTLPLIPEAGTLHAFHQYTILSPQRAALQAFLANRGVQTAILYPKPIHQMPAYLDFTRSAGSDCPVAARICGELLCLPIHPALEDRDVALVMRQIRDFFSEVV